MPFVRANCNCGDALELDGFSPESNAVGSATWKHLMEWCFRHHKHGYDARVSGGPRLGSKR